MGWTQERAQKYLKARAPTQAQSEVNRYIEEGRNVPEQRNSGAVSWVGLLPRLVGVRRLL